MVTQTRLSHHNKFISAENITILSVSSDDYIYRKRKGAIDLTSRGFAKGPGDRGSVPARVITKIQKLVRNAALFNTQYRLRIKGKVEQSKEKVALFPKPRCSSY